MLIAVIHFAGVVAALLTIVLVSGNWSNKAGCKRLERLLEVTSLKLTLPLHRVLAGEYNERIARYMVDRYDTNRLVNRLSDVVQPVFLILELTSYIAQLGIVAFSAWLVFTKDPGYAVFTWFAVPLAVAFLGINTTASATLYLITGRVPGEARQMRKFAVWLQMRPNINPMHWLEWYVVSELKKSMKQLDRSL